MYAGLRAWSHVHTYTHTHIHQHIRTAIRARTSTFGYWRVKRSLFLVPDAACEKKRCTSGGCCRWALSSYTTWSSLCSSSRFSYNRNRLQSNRRTRVSQYVDFWSRMHEAQLQNLKQNRRRCQWSLLKMLLANRRIDLRYKRQYRYYEPFEFTWLLRPPVQLGIRIFKLFALPQKVFRIKSERRQWYWINFFYRNS